MKVLSMYAIGNYALLNIILLGLNYGWCSGCLQDVQEVTTHNEKGMLLRILSSIGLSDVIPVWKPT